MPRFDTRLLDPTFRPTNGVPGFTPRTPPGGRPPQTPPAPPPPPAQSVATGDNGDGSGDFTREAMTAVLTEALQSTIGEVHRDDVQEAILILLSRLVVEMSVIRAIMLGAQDQGGDEW